jgi:hypothetical protein
LPAFPITDYVGELKRCTGGGIGTHGTIRLAALSCVLDSSTSSAS